VLLSWLRDALQRAAGVDGREPIDISYKLGTIKPEMKNELSFIFG
jgi:hypothetical protein